MTPQKDNTVWHTIDPKDPSTLPSSEGVYLVSWVQFEEYGEDDVGFLRCTSLAEYSPEQWDNDKTLLRMEGWRMKNGAHEGDSDPEYEQVTPSTLGDVDLDGSWIEAWAECPTYPGNPHSEAWLGEVGKHLFGQRQKFEEEFWDNYPADEDDEEDEFYD